MRSQAAVCERTSLKLNDAIAGMCSVLVRLTNTKRRMKLHACIKSKDENVMNLSTAEWEAALDGEKVSLRLKEISDRNQERGNMHCQLRTYVNEVEVSLYCYINDWRRKRRPY